MNKDDRSTEPQFFLDRWSRRKAEARETPATVEAPAATPAIDDEPPVLPPIDELTLDSDFSGFFHPKVDEDLRRSALRKLFSDPHFNVMDGLDVYIDDYSQTVPIPPEMLAGLKQAQRILQWAKEDEETEKGTAITDAPPAANPALEEPAAPAMNASDTLGEPADSLDPASDAAE